MDTTPEYIKMCEKAVPDLREYFTSNIAKLRPMFIYDIGIDRVCVFLWTPESIRQKLGTKRDDLILSIEHERDRGLWIPEGMETPIVPLWRQDQLQEIWRQEYLKRPSKYGWFGEFCNFIGDVYSDYDLMNADEVFESMEQLWLAFVMKEKYGKVWNGEEWV